MTSRSIESDNRKLSDRSAALRRLLCYGLSVGLLFAVSSCSKKSGPEPPPPVAPSGITADNGLYYKAVMGTSSISPALQFTVRDDNGVVAPNTTVKCVRLVGDGTVLSDSLKTNNLGQVTFPYAFNGHRGDAILMARVPGVDSEQVYVRANTLIPGNGGQAQYILLSDKYRDVKHYNGLPASVDPDPNSWIVYANYEQSLGVVFVLPDVKHDSTAVDSADVDAIIVNTVYSGKTKDSIGVGSTLQAVRAIYGDPDTIYYDPPDPPIFISYANEGLVFYGNTQQLNGIPVLDTIIHEIHLFNSVTNPNPAKERVVGNGKIVNRDVADRGYHRYVGPK